MNIDEIRELLPLYAAGTLNAEEYNRVREAVNLSHELQEELKFWQGVNDVVRISANFERQGHLSPPDVVDFIEGKATAEKRAAIESHISICEECMNDIALIRQTYSLREMPLASRGEEKYRISIPGTIRNSFRKPRAYFVAAGFAVIALLMVFVFSKRQAIEKDRISFLIPYQQELRGTASPSLPELHIKPDISHIDFKLPYPHSTLTNILYTVSLIFPNQEIHNISNKVAMTSFDNTFDTLKISIASATLTQDGRYTLSVAEIPSTLPAGTEAQTTLYKFLVSRN